MDGYRTANLPWTPQRVIPCALALLLQAALTSGCALSHGSSNPSREETRAVDSGTREPGAAPSQQDAGSATHVPLEDASVPASEDAGGAAPPSPDLVFTTLDGLTATYQILNVGDFSKVRVLGSTQLSATNTSHPLGYTPDGQKLLIEIRRPDAMTYAISYPCREAFCTPSSSRYFEVLTIAAPTSSDDFPSVLFAADSSGIALVFKQSIYYLPLTNTRPSGPALHLTDFVVDKAAFVAGGRALVAHVGDSKPVDGKDPPKRAQLFDLRPPSGAPFQVFALQDEGIRSYDYEIRVAPDGEHFVVQLQRDSRVHEYAFSTSAVLSGDAVGRRIGEEYHFVVHVTDARIVTQNGARVLAERWDGTNPILLPITSQHEPQGCGERLLGASERGAIEVVDLPGFEEATGPRNARELQDLAWPYPDYGQGLRFAGRCQRAIAVYRLEPDVIINLETLALTVGEHLGSSTFSPDASFMRWGNYGVQSLYRLEGLATPEVAYRPRRLFSAANGFAQKSPFFMAAAPLDDPLLPFIYQIDLSGSGPATVRAVSKHVVAAYGTLITSPDDRFVVYGATPPSVPHDFGLDDPGVHEIDLTTLASERLTSASDYTDGALADLVQLPGTRSFLARVVYASAGPPALYLAQPDADDAWLSQISPDRASWPFAGSTGLQVSSDGLFAAFTSIGPQGTTLSVQSLKHAETETVSVVATLTEDRFAYSSADAALFAIGGFSRGLGLLYWLVPPNLKGGGWAPSWPKRVDLATGTVTPLGTLVEGARTNHMRVAELTGRAFFTSWKEDVTTLHMVEAQNPTRTVDIAAGGSFDYVLTPDERFLIYGIGQPDYSYELHVYDLATRTDRQAKTEGSVIQMRPSEGASLVVFEEARGTVLVRTNKGALCRVPLSDPSATITILRGIGLSGDISMDRNHTRFAWGGVSEKAFFVDLEKSPTPIPITLTGQSADRVLMSPDGRFVLAQSARANRTIWQRLDARDLTLPAVALADAYPYYLSFDPSGRYVLGADATDHFAVWALDAPEVAHVLKHARRATWVR